MLLRVVSTSHAGFADFAALTKLCVFVATALQWSSRFKHTFHALCSAPAGPTATSKMVPAATCSPEGTSDSTSAPKCCNTRAASSVAHTVASSRVKNSMRAGLSLMPSICVVRSIYGTSSAISWSIRASEITTSIATSHLWKLLRLWYHECARASTPSDVPASMHAIALPRPYSLLKTHMAPGRIHFNYP